MQGGNNEHQQNYEHNQIVWGKIVGYPWWPGIINLQQSQLKPDFYHVDFFGDSPSHCVLPATKLVKYQEFDKKKNTGRPSPQLKRAINEASVLLSTLEESKNNPASTKHLCSNIVDNQYTVLPFAKSVLESEKNQPSPTTLNKQNTLNDLIQPQIIEQQIIKVPKKRGRKPKLLQKKHKLQQKQLERQNRVFLKVKKERVKDLLRRYRLENIPKYVTEKKQVNLQPLICRKIYRILKMNGCNMEEKHQMAINLREKTRKVADLMKIANLTKDGRNIIQEEIFSQQKQELPQITHKPDLLPSLN